MKLIVYYFFLVSFLICNFSIIQAQDVDEIIAKHIKAHGDTDKWDNIRSMKITGSFTAFSVEKDFFAIKTDNGTYYSELYLGQHKVIESFDGKSGWTIDPWQDFIFPRELNKSEINVFNQKADFFTPFYKYKEKGYKVELIGEQNVDGINTYVIKLTRPNGHSETWYLDTNTYLEYKCESDWVDFAYDSPAESYFDDFRNVDGIVIPFFIERTFSQRDRILQIKDIEFNVDIDESIFEMPRSAEIKKLAFLIGEWNVKVDVWTRSGSWYNIDSTISTISYIATNMIEEKIQYDRIFVQSNIVDYTYNSSTEKYRITVFNNFSSDIEIFEGNFTDSTFVVENTFISYGDSTQNNNPFQVVFSDIEKDSFIVGVNYSRDKGATWNPRDKFTYTRGKD
ncbi:MAG: hypothetical protein CL661_05800 [Bacteroidetes bacterium]|jgi:hypothetical protein|nr:hypothetical protein [Bacteroidota bacterium]